MLQVGVARLSLSHKTTYLFVLTNKTNFNVKVYYRITLSLANNQNCHRRLKLRFERRQRKKTNILGTSLTRARFELTVFQIQVGSVTDSVKKVGSQRVNINNNDDDINTNLVQFNGYSLTYRINNTTACYYCICRSLSARHGASSGCGWRNGLRYGGWLRIN